MIALPNLDRGHYMRYVARLINPRIMMLAKICHEIVAVFCWPREAKCPTPLRPAGGSPFDHPAPRRSRPTRPVTAHPTAHCDQRKRTEAASGPLLSHCLRLA